MKGLLLKLNEGFKSYDHLKLPFMSKKLKTFIGKFSKWVSGNVGRMLNSVGYAEF